MKTEPVRRFTSQHRLMVAIFGAVIIAFVMTSISMSLYVTSGAQVLDLSRPGYETARQTINENRFESESFESEGPINSEVMAEFQKIYRERYEGLVKIDDYSDQKVLSDESLRLTAETN